jgi:hypothetical protein
MRNKKSRKQLKRISLKRMVNVQTVTIKDATIMVYSKNRNPEQVPDKLWEELLNLHLQEGRYN